MATHAISLATAQAELEKAEAELKRQQEEIEQLRSFVQGYEVMLRRVGADAQQLPLPTGAKPKPKVKASSTKPNAGTKGLTVVGMAVQELRKFGDLLDSADLTDRMMASGYKPKGTSKPKDSVYATLFHEAKKADSPLVKVGAKWGLREWKRG